MHYVILIINTITPPSGKIEKIVAEFEKLGSDGGNRHDF